MDPLGTTDPLGIITASRHDDDLRIPDWPTASERLSNRGTTEKWLGFAKELINLRPAELGAVLHLWGVLRELGLLSDRAEAERRLREPTGRSVARSEDKLDLDILVGESVAELASAAE